MKVYITEHALTKGIIEAEAEETVHERMIAVKMKGRGWDFFLKPHWYRYKEEAVARAEKMRDLKIKSLEKKLEKLRALKF